MKPHHKSKLPFVAVLAWTWLLQPSPAALIQPLPASPKGDPVETRTLDSSQVQIVPVARNRVTTVSFPGPIQALDGAFLTSGGEQPGLFQFSHTKGTRFFSLRGLIAGAETNLNVRWNDHTYVLVLKDSPQPVLSLIFEDEQKAVDARAESTTTPGVLIGLLDKAKAFPFLQEHHPKAVQDVAHADFLKQPKVFDYQDFEARLLEVFRFDQRDTLVFRLQLHNRADKEIQYRADSFRVRTGDLVFPQSVSDADGIIPAYGDAEAWFVITGTPDGGRNELSIANDFIPLLTRITPPRAVPAEAPVSKPDGKEVAP